MDARLTEQQESIRQMVRSLAEKEIEPYIDEWEEQHHFPKHLFRRMADLGLAGMTCAAHAAGSTATSSPTATKRPSRLTLTLYWNS